MRLRINNHMSSGIMTFCIMYMLSQISCTTQSIDMDTVKKSKGWIDNSTYAMIARGRPIKSLNSETKQKNSAKRAALFNARFKILKRFKSLSTLKSEQSTDPEVLRKNALLIKKVIKNGKIVFENFDQRNNCEIIYQVHHRNLKDIINHTDLSIIDVVY